MIKKTSLIMMIAGFLFWGLSIWLAFAFPNTWMVFLPGVFVSGTIFIVAGFVTPVIAEGVAGSGSRQTEEESSREKLETKKKVIRGKISELNRILKYGNPNAVLAVANDLKGYIRSNFTFKDMDDEIKSALNDAEEVIKKVEFQV